MQALSQTLIKNMLYRQTRRELATSKEETADKLVRAHCGATDWGIRANWRDRILGETAPDWFQLTPDHFSTLVKKGRNRTTWRIRLGSDTIFVKLLNTCGLWEKLRQFFQGTPAEREWLACRRAERLGIPVPHGLAVGVRNGKARCNVFLAEYLTRAVPFAGFWREHITTHSAAERRRRAVSFIESLAKLIALAHERGFHHRDGHPNNILLQSLPDGDKRAAFVDIYGARFTPRPVSMRRAIHSLAQLDQHFQRTATQAERLRFLQRYLQNRASLRQDSSDRARKRQWSRQVVQARQRLASTLARQWDRRLRVNGKYFSRLRLGDGWTATIVLKLERRHVFPEPEVPDRSLEEWRSLLQRELTSAHASGRPAEAIRDSGPESELESAEDSTICMERQQVDNLFERIRAGLGGSQHSRRFEQCHRQRHRDQHVPLILGWAEHRRGILVDQTVLIRESQRRTSSTRP